MSVVGNGIAVAVVGCYLCCWWWWCVVVVVVVVAVVVVGVGVAY